VLSPGRRNAAAAGDDEEDGPDDMFFGGGHKAGSKRPAGEEDELYQQTKVSESERGIRVCGVGEGRIKSEHDPKSCWPPGGQPSPAPYNRLCRACLSPTAQAAAADRKRAKQERQPATTLHPPLPDKLVDGARGISSAIERNRGLTPHRRKDLKNPRKKHRLAFEKAQVRRKGAVQDVRTPSAATYGGEQTGVKSRVVKSRKLG
jgi:hypothetical protein